MDRIGRIKNVLAGEKTDHVPCAFWFHFPEHSMGGKEMAEAHIDYFRSVKPDLLKVMNDNDYVPEGIDVVREASDWLRLEPASIKSTGYLAQIDGLRRIVDELGQVVFLPTTIFNPYSIGNKISNGKLLQHLEIEPEAVSKGLATIADSLAEFVKLCVHTGASGIYFSAQGGELTKFTEKQHELYIKPHDLTVLHAAEVSGAPCNILHICGHELRLESFRDYPATLINWAPQHGNLSVSLGRELFKRPVVGGVDQRGAIVSGPESEITSEIERTLSETDTVGFMVGAGCTLPNDVNLEHLIWAREAVVKHTIN